MKIQSLTCFAAIFLLIITAPFSRAVELIQTVSREHPSFQVAKAKMTIGLDGYVYLSSGGNDSYVLRLTRTGK